MKREQCHPWGHSPNEGYSQDSNHNRSQSQWVHKEANITEILFSSTSWVLLIFFLCQLLYKGWGIIPEIIPHLCLSPQTSSKHPPPSSSLSANDFAFSCHGENRCVLKITSIHSHPHVYLLHYIQPMCSAILPAAADGLSCATEARLSVSGLDPPYLTFLAHWWSNCLFPPTLSNFPFAFLTSMRTPWRNCFQGSWFT